MEQNKLKQKNTSELFNLLITVMERLRGPDGCPWDKKQTHQSLRACLLEETYEVLQTIDDSQNSNMCEELGDLLLQIIFHSQIAQENQQFQIKDVLISIIKKLIRRHPHVFGDEKITDSDTAIKQWEKIKAQEKKGDASLFSGLPRELPALLRAYRLGSKAAHVGFDWQNFHGVLEKVKEEFNELENAISHQNNEETTEEIGDLLFSIAQLGRKLKINPEDALRMASQKFQNRFEWMEQKIKEQGLLLADCQPSQLETVWDAAKVALK